MSRILITGGVRSGKSRFAQELAAGIGGEVLFVATALPVDGEMAERIREHRRTRPPSWTTLELPRYIGRGIKEKAEDARVVLIDCITLLIGNIFTGHACPNEEHIDSSLVEKECLAEIDELLDCMKSRDASFIIVTNEVGEGVVPEYKIGRLYRDVLGLANQRLAQEMDTVYLMVAGIPLKIKPDDKR